MESAENDDRITRKTRLDEFSWYLMVMGFIGLLAAGLCFYFFRNRPLRYADFSLDANVLGKYLLIAGMASYAAGRTVHYYRRFRKRKGRVP